MLATSAAVLPGTDLPLVRGKARACAPVLDANGAFERRAVPPAAGHVVAVEFATIAAANSYWRGARGLRVASGGTVSHRPQSYDVTAFQLKLFRR